MAGSRLEKIGTIFSRYFSFINSRKFNELIQKHFWKRRTSGLLRSGALKAEDKPIWYDVYAAFPPIAEPRFDRPAPNVPVRQIFYAEDAVRAKYHRHTSKQLGAINLLDTKYQTQTQQFLTSYAHIKEQGAISEEAIFDAAVEVIKDKLSKEYDNQPRDSPGLLDSFSEAKTTAAAAISDKKGTAAKANVDFKNIFSD